MTEAEARAALAAFDGVGDVEPWIAAHPWMAVQGGWVVPEPSQGRRFLVKHAPGGVRASAFMGRAEPAVWVVPDRPTRAAASSPDG